MDYKKRFLLNDFVKGRRTFNNEVVEGRFNGFHLHNKLDPTSVVGVICVESDRCYDVVAGSIELLESEDERIRKAIISTIKSQGFISDEETLRQCVAWLEKRKTKLSCTPIDYSCANVPQKDWSENETVILSPYEVEFCKEFCGHNPDYYTTEGWKIIKNDYAIFKEIVKKDLENETKQEWSEKCIADVFEKVGLTKIVREQSNDNLTKALQDAMIELSQI